PPFRAPAPISAPAWATPPGASSALAAAISDPGSATVRTAAKGGMATRSCRGFDCCGGCSTRPNDHDAPPGLIVLTVIDGRASRGAGAGEVDDRACALAGGGGAAGGLGIDCPLFRRGDPVPQPGRLPAGGGADRSNAAGPGGVDARERSRPAVRP